MPIEPGDSWFSPKCIEVQPCGFTSGGSALNGLGGESLPNPTKRRMPEVQTVGVSQWGISSIVERETTQITS